MKGYLVVTYRDAFQQETTRQYELAEAEGGTVGEDLVELRANAQAILAQLLALTGAVVVQASLNVTDAEFSLDGGLTSPQSGSNVSDDGVLSVALTGGGKGTLRIPTPRSTIVDSFGSPVLPNFYGYASMFFPGAAGMLSDGETVDNTKANSGILKAWRASRGRRNN